jgi:hypothetical protein
METQLPSAKLAGEKQWAQTHLNLLGSLKVKHSDEYALPEEKRPKRAPLVQVRRCKPSTLRY